MVIQEIPNPYEVILYDRKGNKKVLVSRENELNMVYEIQEWINVIEGRSQAACYNQYSMMELEVMEEVKKQLGIYFTADKEELWKKY